MAIDRHPGRNSPTFVVEGHPESYIGVIERHGVASRILRARRCPCVADTGGPNLYCTLCRGDGFIYDFQRKMLQSDEDSDVKADRSVVNPFRVPIIEPVKVERLIAPEQGGIMAYGIRAFDRYSIYIEGEPLPRPYEKMRVSYYFDRYDYVEKEYPAVDPNTKILTVSGTRFDDGHRSSNVKEAHGDITIVEEVVDEATGYTFSGYAFNKNRIYLSDNSPAPTPGKVRIRYYFCPVEKVLTSDIENRNVIEKWISELLTGSIRMTVKPWFDLGNGDLITLLTPEFARDEIIAHNSTGIDRLLEFDVSTIDDVIFDEVGRQYRRGIDYILKNYHDITWIGAQPAAGKKLSVRYTYHPTFAIFQDQVQPNTLENKQYPKTFYGKVWTRTLNKDVEKLGNTQYVYTDTGTETTDGLEENVNDERNGGGYAY